MPENSTDAGTMLGLAERTAFVLNEATLGFLALASLFLGFVPLVFALGQSGALLLQAADLFIVICFGAEYLAGLVRADNGMRYVRSRWRLLDAFIIVTALIALLPFSHALLSSSPALRLIRLFRVALLGSRVVVASGDKAKGRLAVEAHYPFAADALVPGASHFEAVDWDSVRLRLGSDSEDWIVLSGVDRERLGVIAAGLDVPPAILQAKLYDGTFPRLDRIKDKAVLFLWYPCLSGTTETWQVERTRILLVGSLDKIVLMSRKPTDLLYALQAYRLEHKVDTPLLIYAACGLLGTIRDAYSKVVERLEQEQAMLEGSELQMRDRTFLERTFRLRTEISRVRGNLRHLRSVVRDVAEHPLGIQDVDPPATALPDGATVQLALITNAVDDLYDRVDDLHETLAALVDLRLNVSSFQMNKVMRLLAILTTLALIPSVAGGVLGMNLIDAPWSPALAQVVFGLTAGMAFSLYLFAIKGWLR